MLNRIMETIRDTAGLVNKSLAKPGSDKGSESAENSPVAVRKYNLSYVGREVLEWVINGHPAPPPHYVKVLNLCHIVSVGNYKRFIETGTLGGATSKIIAQMPGVRVDTIEISEAMWQSARQNLSELSNVDFHLGDSTTVLPEILATLQEPALFWLDAHHSGGQTGRGAKATPISDEISAIKKHSVSGHALLIDDMRSFTGRNDYPSSEEVVTIFKEIWPEYSVEIRDDLMFVLPKHVADQVKSTPFGALDCPIIAP